MYTQVLFVFALFTTSVWSHQAFACSCTPMRPPAEALANASAVFLGTVTAIEPEAAEVEPADYRVQFDVARVWKGGLAAQTSLLTPMHEASCGYTFEVGKRYLVYTYTDLEGSLNTTYCDRTRPVESAAEDLSFLGPGEVPSNVTASRWFGERRRYAHALFATAEECEEARRVTEFLNCEWEVSLGLGGRATMVITDITNHGTYEIRGDKVVLDIEESIELPRRVTFTASSDRNRLIWGWDGTVWHRRGE